MSPFDFIPPHIARLVGGCDALVPVLAPTDPHVQLGTAHRGSVGDRLDAGGVVDMRQDTLCAKKEAAIQIEKIGRLAVALAQMNDGGCCTTARWHLRIGPPFGKRHHTMQHGTGQATMHLGHTITHALLALEAPVRGVVFLFAQLARDVARGLSRQRRWWRTEGRGYQGHQTEISGQFGHIAILDIALGSVDGAGNGVPGLGCLAADPAGKAGGAKVMTTRQHARQADGFIKRVVADAALEERGDVGGEGRRGKGRTLPLRMRSRRHGFLLCVA